MRRLLGLCVILLTLVPISASSFAAKPTPNDQATSNPPTMIVFIDPKVPLAAQVSNITVLFNPKELGLNKSVPWGHSHGSHGDTPSLEFTAGEPYTAHVELMFDGYETKTDVRGALGPLLNLQFPNQTSARPPVVRFMWGALGQPGMEFKGVIASMDVKYTLFMEDGTPVRATVNVTFEETTKAHEPQRGAPGNETRH